MGVVLTNDGCGQCQPWEGGPELFKKEGGANHEGQASKQC